MIHYGTYAYEYGAEDEFTPITNCGKPWPGEFNLRAHSVTYDVHAVTCVRCLGFTDPRADLADALTDLRVAIWSRVHPVLNWVLRAVTRR